MTAAYRTYLDYLASDHWVAMRRRVTAAAEGRCEACADERKLVGHHLIYRTPLESCVDDDIMCLCETCHNAFHRWLQAVNRKESDYGRAQTRTVILRLRSGGCPPPEVKFTLPVSRPEPKRAAVDLSKAHSLWEVARTMLSAHDMSVFEMKCGGRPMLGKGRWNRAVKALQRKTGRSFLFLKDGPKGRAARQTLATHP